jgi:PAS domain S-box-containing protein
MMRIDNPNLDFNLIIDQIPGNIYWKSLDGDVLGCNIILAQLCGFPTVKSILGTSMFDLIPKEQAEEVLKMDQEVLDKNQLISRYETVVVEGKTHHFISKKAPLKNAQGEIEGIIGVSFDITAEYEAQLRKFQMYEHIISLVPAHVYWKDLNGVYLGCNDQQAKSAGLKSREEFVGKTDADFPWHAFADEIKQMDQQILNTGKEQMREESAYMADGFLHTYISHKSPLIDDTGKIIGIIGISVDISQQKELERLRAERAQVSQLIAASIAHELRTPLASVDMMASTCGDLLPALIQCYKEHGPKDETALSPKQLQALQKIPEKLKAVTTAADTFIDMMLMKVDLRKAKSEELVSLTMSTCLQNSVDLYPLTQGDKALLEIDYTHDFSFTGDPTLIRHVFFNLLKNALYHVKAAGKGKIMVWMEPGKEKNILHFKDTGEGVAPDVLPHLFDHFFSKTRHGTGIGLALCKIIMDEFDGTISCDSIQGEYTDFVLSFPTIAKNPL